ncbi:hypothetical protein [Streptomyces sp. NPDC047108]|uniref:hypothetical protein n=1 Tax=Streptomyces sp. NPDC047108 TaxID=3155025 RepID=UPI0033CE0680
MGGRRAGGQGGSRERRVRGPVRVTAVAGVLAALTLASGCGDDGGSTAEKAERKPSPVAPAPANIEKIAARTGCTAEIRTEAEELREGVCRNASGEYLVTTFPKEKLKLVWLDSASMYGGTYLVGPRWAISGKPALLKELRTKVGGRLEDVSDRNGSASTQDSP